MAGIGEKLPVQFRAAQRGRPGCLDYRLRGVFRRQHLGNEVKIADYDREQVVEVVRHAPGQLSDNFHFLRLP